MIVLTVGALPALLGIALLAALAAWWAHRLETGIPFRPLVEAVSIVAYLGLFFLVESGTWFGFGSTAPLYLLILAGAGLIAAIYTFDASRIFSLPDRRLGYRGGTGIAVAWLLILWADLAVQVVLLGRVTILNWVVLQGIPNPGAAWAGIVPDHVQWAFIAVDALFSLSTGLLIGQSVGIYACMARLPWAGPPTRAGPGRASHR